MNILLLAGGKSTRMQGQDKALMKYRGKPMIEHILQQCIGLGHDKIIISCNQNQELYARYSANLIDDNNYAEITPFSGPLLGILSTLDKYLAGSLLVLPCDTPQISQELIQLLITKHRLSTAKVSCLTIGGQLQPLHSIVNQEIRDDLYHYLANGKRRAQEFMQSQEPNLVDATRFQKQLQNFNHPEDLT